MLREKGAARQAMAAQCKDDAIRGDDRMISTINGNALSIPLPDKVVQCVITSPPYWGLRDYGTEKWEGGNPECDHSPARKNGDDSSTLSGGKETISHKHEGYKDTCGKCGAIRIDQQIGLESTPQAYVARIVAAMRECWRVMRDDATLWLNLGDSYSTGSDNLGRTLDERDRRVGRAEFGEQTENGWAKHRKVPDGLKPKDLVGIPWRVAFALQDDGWYLRSDIIWHKPNPMPESVTDRPTKAHEYIFLLAKQERYYYDAEAIREKAIGDTTGGFGMNYDRARKEIMSGGTPSNVKGKSWENRNRRSVWTVATSPYSGAHFATFPPALVEPMILAGSRLGDIVLDPFAGTSTVGRVCAKHRRKFIGVELNPAYIQLAEDRTSRVQITLME